MAKKSDETPAPQEQNEVAALKAQMDQLLDHMVQQQDEIAQLRAQQSVTQGAQTQPSEPQEDAELKALQAEFADYPAIQVFSNRIELGLPSNLAIRLKDEPPVQEDPKGAKRKWYLRWVNAAKEGRIQHITAEGYLPVEWNELQDPESLAAGDKATVYVRMGQGGVERLYKLPLKLYEFKKRRQREAANADLQSESKLRQAMVQGVEQRVKEMGGNADQAGAFVHGQVTATIKQLPKETVTI